MQRDTRGQVGRRSVILSGLAAVGLPASGHAAEILGGTTPASQRAQPLQPVVPGPNRFFTPAEAGIVAAIADTMIPADPTTPGGSEAGCVTFLDRRLAGAYGAGADMYMRGPVGRTPTPQQGYQFALAPAALYRQQLARLDATCRSSDAGKGFADLDPDARSRTLKAMEGAAPPFDREQAGFFDLMLHDVMSGFFSDPIYGGNKDMCAWRMIGFPGARYDYRGFVTAHGERYPLGTVDLAGRVIPAGQAG